MSKDIFENLVNEMTQQVLQAVQEQVQPAITEAINQRLDAVINGDNIAKLIDNKINLVLAQYSPDMATIDSKLQDTLAAWSSHMEATAKSMTEQTVRQKINEVDLEGLVSTVIQRNIEPGKVHYPFTENTINGSAIDLATLRITGDNVQGGVIKNFGSTGIDDKASTCMVTVMDQGTVFENTLYAPRIEIKGGAVIDGDLDIQGQIVDSPAYRQLISDVAVATQSTITDDVLTNHQNVIFERMLTEGIDLGKISLNGRVIVDGQKLLNVFHSQLQTVGTLRDLQTDGDTLLSGTLFASNKRVGVNTMDPKTALSIWDEEIEIGMGKQQQGVARIATNRDHTLVLGTNEQDNLTLNTDGSTTVKQLKINSMTFTSEPVPPSYNAARGTVVFNENPMLGGPLGWISLGDARWANFGIID
jgi:hypothetical protein